MARASSVRGARRLIAGALLGALAVVAIGFTAVARQSGRTLVLESADAPSGSALASDLVPGQADAFVDDSYRELARYDSSRGLLRVFTARSVVRPTWTCIGLADDTGIGYSCATKLLPDGFMHVSRSIIENERFLVGVVAPPVARVSFTELSGRTATVTVRNQTFLFVGTTGRGRLVGRDSAGRVLVEKIVEFSE